MSSIFFIGQIDNLSALHSVEKQWIGLILVGKFHPLRSLQNVTDSDLLQIPMASNVSEQLASIWAARKNRMDVVVAICLGKSSKVSTL